MISIHLNWPIQMTEREYSEKEIDDGKYIRDRINWMLFFSLSLFLSLFFFLSQDRPPFNRWRNNGHEYPLSTHKWFIDWLFWCYISFWIRAKNTLRDAMQCDARLTNVSSNPASVQTLAHFKLIISHFISSKHIIEISLLVRESRVCVDSTFLHIT